MLHPCVEWHSKIQPLHPTILDCKKPIEFYGFSTVFNTGFPQGTSTGWEEHRSVFPQINDALHLISTGFIRFIGLRGWILRVTSEEPQKKNQRAEKHHERGNST